MTSKVQPVGDYSTVDRENLGPQGCVIFGERTNKERNGETPLRMRKYFERIRKQLLNEAEQDMKNSADQGGCYPPRPSASVDNTLLDLQNSSYPTQPHSIIAKYSLPRKKLNN